LPQTCEGDSYGAPWRVGVSGGGFRTDLSLGGRDAELGEESLTVLAGWHGNPRFGIEGGVGVILDGRLASDGIEHDVGAGIAVSATVSWLAVPETVRRPFVQVAGTLSASTTTTKIETGDAEAVRLTAVDLRATVIAGKTFAGRFTPNVAGRLFGGPIFWTREGEDVTGSDRRHFSVGAGVTLRLPGRLDVFAELMPLGERSASLGAGLSF
jgi:hypothetical protein